MQFAPRPKRAPSFAVLRRALACLTLGALLHGAGAHAGIDTRILVALESRSVKVRVAAVGALSQSTDGNARVILEGMLDDSSAAVRAATLDALARLGDTAAIDAVSDRTKDKDRMVAGAAQRALETLRTKQAALAAAEAAQAAAAEAPAAPTTPQPAQDATPVRSARRKPTRRATREKRKLTQAKKGAVLVSIANVKDASGSGIKGLGRGLQNALGRAIERDRRMAFDAKRSGVKSGYAVSARIARVREYQQGNARILELKCKMTVAQMPGRILRLSANATAAAGIEGTSLSPAERKELAADALKACAPALAKDFTDYAYKKRKRR